MADKDILDLNVAMSKLAELRTIFHSEADFQFALAIQLHEIWPELEVRLEIPQSNRITLVILVLGPSDHDRFAIELKYKTALWSGEVAGEAFNLKNHGADDLGGYDIIKDIRRIELLAADGSVSSGAVIALTNEPLYWTTTLKNKADQRSRVSGPRRPDLEWNPFLGSEYGWNK
jgi:hypothetical protein